MLLSRYHYTLSYRPGPSIAHADRLIHLQTEDPAEVLARVYPQVLLSNVVAEATANVVKKLRRGHKLGLDKEGNT